MTIDLLITNARVRTFDPQTPWAEAVGIRDGRITYVGDSADAPAAKQPNRCRRAPSHAGRSSTATTTCCSASTRTRCPWKAPTISTKSAAGSANSRAPQARSGVDLRRERGVLRRRGAPSQRRRPGRPDRQAHLRHHLRPALGLAEPARAGVLGIAGGTDVAWGRPERDATTGEPTGWVTDFYTSAMTEAGLAALQANIPMYSPERRYRKLRSSMRMATALGITTVVEPQVPLAELPLFERALDEGVLTSRVIAALFHPVGADGAFRQRLRDAVDRTAHGPDAAPGAGQALRRRRDRTAHGAHARGLRQPPRRARAAQLSRTAPWSTSSANSTGWASRPTRTPPATRASGSPSMPSRRPRAPTGRTTAGTASSTSNACIPTTCPASPNSG